MTQQMNPFNAGCQHVDHPSDAHVGLSCEMRPRYGPGASFVSWRCDNDIAHPLCLSVGLSTGRRTPSSPGAGRGPPTSVDRTTAGAGGLTRRRAAGSGLEPQNHRPIGIGTGASRYAFRRQAGVACIRR
ncbi:hypothetical protein EVAR_53151_1 [Eumeta japonica]|uniref:Uncharacterized protein n=1 Tax=Eumeta variegata TaxID=151549 RepID=A0A4C1YBA1_EUMVA|nr:hypothetical protein EVAR_53151_1 [Eumeta japonica]